MEDREKLRKERLNMLLKKQEEMKTLKRLEKEMKEIIDFKINEIDVKEGNKIFE